MNKIVKKIFKKNCSGMTLIELMVVITILSMVILGLVSFFGGGIRSWISGQNQLQAQREARIALDRMVREIREANRVIEGSNSFEKGIEVSFPKDFNRNNLVFRYDESSQSIRTGNNNILLDNVPPGGFVISYFDSSGVSCLPDKNASKIAVSIEVDIDRNNSPDISLRTEINLRNYGRL